MQFTDVEVMAVDPTNPDVLYVGMLLGPGAPSFFADGVYKSIDGGETWFPAMAGLGDHGCYWGWDCEYAPAVFRFFLDPDEPQVLFASTTERGLYRTEDGGRWWEFVGGPEGGFEGGPSSCVMAGPVGKGSNGIYHAACNNFRYRSLDGGKNWEEVPSLSSLGRYLSAFGFDRRYPDRVWAGMCMGAGPEPGEGYMFLSEDGGITWTELGQDIDDYCQGYGGVRSISICDADPNQMSASVWQCGLFVSTDGGLSWTHASHPLDGSWTFTAAYAPLPDRCRLYAGEGNGGFFWSEDAGAHWREELDVTLDYVFFNPFLPEIMMGIVVQRASGADLFQLWVKE